MAKIKLYPAIVATVLCFLLMSAFGFNPILEAKQNRLSIIEPDVPEVVGGREATPGAYPFMGMLTRRGSDSLHCGGALIDPEWVLTAAHCVDEFDQSDEIDVIFGRHDRRQSADGLRVTSQAIYIHPEFGVDWFPNADIALIHLDRPVTAYSAVNVGREEQLNTVGRMATAVGWGGEVGEPLNDTLHEVELPILRSLDCLWRDFHGIFGSVAERMLCIGVKGGGAATCFGDGGSPVLTRDDEAWVLIGVTSVVDEECGERDAQDRNSAHVQVTAYTEWIDAHLNSNPPYPPLTNGLFHRVPDQYEPNNDPLTATTLLTSTEPVSQDHIISSGSDEDWFTFTLTQSSRIVTELTMNDEEETLSHLTMTLFNPDLTVRDEGSVGYSIDSDEEYALSVGGCDWYEDEDVLPAGTYTIRVRDEREHPTSSMYSISQSRDCIQPDQYEPNGSQDTAKTITPGESQAHTFILASDSDWLTFVLTRTTEVVIETYGNARIYTDLALYRDSQADLVGFEEDGGFGGHARLTFCGADALSAGTYTIEIINNIRGRGEGYPVPNQVNSRGGFGFAYTVEMSDCSHLHEPNDSSDTATPITVGETQTHIAEFDDDTDWMTLVLTETTPLVMQVQWNEEYDVSLFRGQDDVLEEIYTRKGISNSIMMWCGRDALSAGTYYLLVEPDYRTGRYTVSTTDCDDIEPNDEPESGTPLTMGEVVTHAISFVGDVDWFTFTLPTTQSLSINISSSLLDIDLYRDDEQVESKRASTYMPYCYENALPSGEYALKVSHAYTRTLPSYTIMMEMCPDTAEPNNSAETAVPITIGNLVEGSIYEAGDEDWFVLTLDEPTAFHLIWTHVPYSSSSTLIRGTLYDAELNVLPWSCSRPPLSAGTYYMRVFTTGNYRMIPGYTFLMEKCEPLPAGHLYWDAYEHDDFYGNGTYPPRQMVVGEWEPHNISDPEDVDWMRFTVDEQSDIAIWIESSEGDMTMGLYTLDRGEYLVTDNDDHHGLNPYIRMCDLHPDVYFIKAHDYLRNETVSEYRVKFEYISCHEPYLYLPMLSVR